MRTDLEEDYVEYVRSRLPRLHKVAYLVLGDGDQADDAVQDALTVLYRRWGHLAEVENLDAYVRTMVVRACLAYRRRRWSRVLLRAEAPDSVVASGSSGVDDRVVVRAALHRLPHRQRVVVILRFLCDLSVAEVAQVLGCSDGTVKSRTHHGLRTLRATLGEPSTASVIASHRTEPT